MDEPGNFVDLSTISKLTLLDQVKLQAQVVVPLLGAFRKELGTERANAIAYRALDEWSRGLFHQLSQSMGKGSRETWTAMMASSGQRIGNDVDFQMLGKIPKRWSSTSRDAVTQISSAPWGSLR